MIHFTTLRYLRQLVLALEQGYGDRLLAIEPELLRTVRRALALHERNCAEIELLGKVLVGLCNKVAPETPERFSNWCLCPGVLAVELVCCNQALIMAVNEVRRD